MVSDGRTIQSFWFAALSALLLTLVPAWARAQVHIAVTRPDAAAPGMTVVSEVLTQVDAAGAFGADGVQPAGTSIELIHPADTARVIVGPLVVSWSGRLVQVPFLVLPGASLGPVPFRVRTLTDSSTVDTLHIVAPLHMGQVSGAIELGLDPYPLSAANTIVIDSATLSNATLRSFTGDAEPLIPGNRRLQPVTILSQGPIRLDHSTVDFDAHGLDGGPGGGGGGHGHSGVGGVGYTGGGSSSSPGGNNTGSGSESIDSAGGYSQTGVRGGGSENGDQGGGGGTGNPFGTSGAAGIGLDTSRAGGYGGGSGGGELAPQIVAYGGGGGGFGTDGTQGAGVGQNQGRQNGGRFLVPLMGGSGGAAGNALNEIFDAGSGGGGGGSVALVSFDSVVATNSTVTASGDSGTTGVALTAGGGGGSGGAIYLAARRGIEADGLAMLAVGGVGGDSARFGGGGGAGGAGRIRLDGAMNACNACSIQGVTSSGLTLDPLPFSNDPVRVSGTANNRSASTLDSVRIYYRTPRTPWRFVDTVRHLVAGNLVWSKTLPASHDSALYIVAMLRVNTPRHSFATDEPAWLLSHVGCAIIRHAPLPELVIADSLDFGGVALTHCLTRALTISNGGGAPLRIDSLLLSGDPAFTLLHAPLSLPPYSTDTLLVQFCPDSTKRTSAWLRLRTNAGDRTLTLLGTGTSRHDSLLVIPARYDFGKLRAGTCDSVDVRLVSVGTDTTYLHGLLFSVPPFTLDILSSDTALAPGDTIGAVLRFCASDTGSFQGVFTLNDRGDSLIAGGASVRPVLQTVGLDLGTLCSLLPYRVVDVLTNIGNDSVRVDSVLLPNGLLLSAAPPRLLLPGKSQPFEWLIQHMDAGTYSDTIYYFTADSTYRTIVRARLGAPELSAQFRGPVPYTCVGVCDTTSIDLKNEGPDTVWLSSVHLTNGGSFSVGPLDSTLAPHSASSATLVFCPAAPGDLLDTCVFAFHTANCDSIERIPVRGVGSVEDLVVGELRFDTTVVGDCRVDSVRVDNPCGPDVEIQHVESDPFVLLSPSLPAQLTSRGTVWLHFQYCPKHAENLDSSVRIDLKDTALLVHATAVARQADSASPRVTFSTSSIVLASSDSGATMVSIDSTTITGLHRLSGIVRYDPGVVAPLGASTGILETLVKPGTLQISGLLDLKVGPAFELRWKGLLGERPSSIIEFEAVLDTAAIVRSVSGEVFISDCSGLQGEISVSGPYRAGTPTPNPASSFVELPLMAGASGPVHLEILDVLGRRVVSRDTPVRKGQQNLRIEVETLPAGQYWLTLRSGTWRDARRLLIAK